MTMEPDLLLATMMTLAVAAAGAAVMEAEPAAVAGEDVAVALLLLLEGEEAPGAEGMQGVGTVGEDLLLDRRERHPLLASTMTMATPTEWVRLSLRISKSNFANPLHLLFTEEDKLCKCGEPAVQRTVRKEGPTKDRQFFACPKPQGEGCGFFEWVDGNGNGGGSNAQQGNGGYVGGAPGPAPRFQGQKRPAPGEDGESSELRSACWPSPKLTDVF